MGRVSFRSQSLGSAPAPHPEPRPGDRASIQAFRATSPQDLFWDLLTFDRLLTGPVIHIIYWAGLALFLLGGFSVIGGAFGVALREEGLMKWLLAFPILVAGFLVLTAGLLLWRSFCEFYVAIFRISDDLKAMRAQLEASGPGATLTGAPSIATPMATPMATSASATGGPQRTQRKPSEPAGEI